MFVVLIFPFSVLSTALCRSDEKLELQWTLEGHQLGVVSVDISHNGALAASSSLDAHIRLWDLESGKQIKSMDAGPGERFSLDGCGDCFLRVWCVSFIWVRMGCRSRVSPDGDTNEILRTCDHRMQSLFFVQVLMKFINAFSM